MKTILYFIVTLMLIAGCANIEEEHDVDSTSETSETSTTSVTRGTKFSSPRTASRESKEAWKTECYVDSDNYSNHFIFTYEDETLSAKEEQYNDENCTDVHALQETNHTFDLMSEENRILITIGSITKRTPQSALSTNSYNSDNKCGYDDWEINNVKNCTRSDEGKKVYCFYQFESTETVNEQPILYLACDSETYPTNFENNVMIFTRYEINL